MQLLRIARYAHSVEGNKDNQKDSESDFDTLVIESTWNRIELKRK